MRVLVQHICDKSCQHTRLRIQWVSTEQSLFIQTARRICKFEKNMQVWIKKKLGTAKEVSWQLINWFQGQVQGTLGGKKKKETINNDLFFYRACHQFSSLCLPFFIITFWQVIMVILSWSLKFKAHLLPQIETSQYRDV